MMDDWNVNNPPPEGHPDVGLFVFDLFKSSLLEKERLGLPDRWYENHRLYRGDHWNKNRRLDATRTRNEVAANLLFANIQRTVANLTARDPVAEVHSVDGVEDDADVVLSQRVKNWWNQEEQGAVLARSALQMEIYGCTIEKYVPNVDQSRIDVVVKDPYSFFPCPGNFEDIQDMPYICDATPMTTMEVEKMFGIEGVVADDTYSLFGEDREDNAPTPSGIRSGVTGASTTDFRGNIHTTQALRGVKEPRALVIECWLRDYTKEPVQIETTVDVETGVPAVEPSEQLKYPGGIRKITVTNSGHLVLDDVPNPNINPNIPREAVERTYGYDNYPFAKACSYEDTTTIWGFAAAEQVGDLQAKINEILSRISAYVALCCMPPLILPKDTGIKDAQITNQAGLIIRPTSSMLAQGIRYLQVPPLPTDFFRALDIHLNFFDRIFAIQDVDRGENPGDVTAASAIALLQQRNNTLLKHKIRATDLLVRERGRWSISFYQNFGWREEQLKVEDDLRFFRGTDYVGRKFNYIVESGSTIAKSDLQVQEDAKALFQMGAIDTRALLEALDFPDYRKILERMGEDKLNLAIQVLIQAGMPEDQAYMLYQTLMQSQGAPGNMPQEATGSAPQNSMQGAVTPQPGVPKAAQGNMQQVDTQMLKM